jgi:hypothetical protein
MSLSWRWTLFPTFSFHPPVTRGRAATWASCNDRQLEEPDEEKRCKTHYNLLLPFVLSANLAGKLDTRRTASDDKDALSIFDARLEGAKKLLGIAP